MVGIEMEIDEYATLSRFEDSYWWHSNLRQLTLSMIRMYARLGAGAKILDIGCGTGGTLAFLKGKLPGARLYGIDNHPLAISMTRMRLQEGLCQSSANALPFPDAVFDAVISLDVFYVREVNDMQALRESYRVLKEGGILVINLPAFEFLRGQHDLAVHTRHRYTAKELEQKLSSAGFAIRRLSYWNAFLLPMVFARRRLRRRRVAPEIPKSDLVVLPPIVNELLKGLLRIERAMLSRVDLPLGSSVLAVAQKIR